jgi:hypothetical protein
MNNRQMELVLIQAVGACQPPLHLSRRPAPGQGAQVVNGEARAPEIEAQRTRVGVRAQTLLHGRVVLLQVGRVPDNNPMVGMCNMHA